MKKYILKELIERTGISERNIKFWCSFYGIKPEKKGRSNYYSLNQLELLHMIKLLSESKYFSQKLIKLFVDFHLNPSEPLTDYFEFFENIQSFFRNAETVKNISFNFFPNVSAHLKNNSKNVKKNTNAVNDEMNFSEKVYDMENTEAVKDDYLL